MPSLGSTGCPANRVLVPGRSRHSAGRLGKVPLCPSLPPNGSVRFNHLPNRILNSARCLPESCDDCQHRLIIRRSDADPSHCLAARSRSRAKIENTAVDHSSSIELVCRHDYASPTRPTEKELSERTTGTCEGETAPVNGPVLEGETDSAIESISSPPSYPGTGLDICRMIRPLESRLSEQSDTRLSSQASQAPRLRMYDSRVMDSWMMVLSQRSSWTGAERLACFPCPLRR